MDGKVQAGALHPTAISRDRPTAVAISPAPASWNLVRSAVALMPEWSWCFNPLLVNGDYFSAETPLLANLLTPGANLPLARRGELLQPLAESGFILMSGHFG